MKKFKWATLAALTTGMIFSFTACGPMAILGVTVWALETAGTAWFLAN